MVAYVGPQLGLDAFNCPHCNAYSQQTWVEVIYNNSAKEKGFSIYPNLFREEYIRKRINGSEVKHVNSASMCSKCSNFTIWEGPILIYPVTSTVELPNEDMPEEVKDLYAEARSIANLSPKSAAALLRLALEKLLIHVGAKKDTIDKMIQDLINKDIISASGLVRKALDSLRVFGNAGVHPTGINLEEDPQAALALFKVLNFVVEKLITDQKEIDAIYSFIPEEKRKKLDERREDVSKQPRNPS